MFRGMDSFKAKMSKFTKRVPRKGAAANRRVAKNWFAEIVRITPKDTNFASSKWDFTVNFKPPNATIKNPRSGQHTPKSTPGFSSFKAGDKLYIYNNVEYMYQLENGWSKQAPVNFFHNSARRANRALAREYRAIR